MASDINSGFNIFGNTLLYLLIPSAVTLAAIGLIYAWYAGPFLSGHTALTSTWNHIGMYIAVSLLFLLPITLIISSFIFEKTNSGGRFTIRNETTNKRLQLNRITRPIPKTTSTIFFILSLAAIAGAFYLTSHFITQIPLAVQIGLAASVLLFAILGFTSDILYAKNGISRRVPLRVFQGIAYASFLGFSLAFSIYGIGAYVLEGGGIGNIFGHQILAGLVILSAFLVLIVAPIVAPIVASIIVQCPDESSYERDNAKNDIMKEFFEYFLNCQTVKEENNKDFPRSWDFVVSSESFKHTLEMASSSESMFFTTENAVIPPHFLPSKAVEHLDGDDHGVVSC